MKADELPWYRFSLVTLTLLFVILLIHTCRLQRHSTLAAHNPLEMPKLTGTGGVGFYKTAQLARAKMMRRPDSSALQVQRRRPALSRFIPRSRRRLEPLEVKLDGQGHLEIWRPTRYTNRNKRSDKQIGKRKKYSSPNPQTFANVPSKYTKTIKELESEKDECALRLAKGGQAAVTILANVLRKVDRHHFMQKKLGLPAKPNEKILSFKDIHPTNLEEKLVKDASMRIFEKLYDEIIIHEIRLRSCPKLVPRQQSFLTWLQKGNPFYVNEPPPSDTFLFTNNKMNSKNLLKKIKKFREKCEHSMPQNEEYHQLQKRLESLEKMLGQYESLSLEEKKQVEAVRWHVVQELNESMKRMEQLKKSNRLNKNLSKVKNTISCENKEKNVTRHHLESQPANDNDNQTTLESTENTETTDNKDSGVPTIPTTSMSPIDGNNQDNNQDNNIETVSVINPKNCTQK